jgi:hypothetical protein
VLTVIIALIVREQHRQTGAACLRLASPALIAAAFCCSLLLLFSL